jgi:fused signal recognition particle receptor
VILFVGINGSGKTTTLAKIASMLKEAGVSSVIAASDTFRAAAIQQLEEHANNLSIKMIKHDYGSDSSAVAFDAIRHAESKGLDVVLIDSAGRLHSNSNLMDELKKLSRVTKPDLKIFVGESITGNDCIEQAQKFNEAIGVDAIILTKADVDEKGGTAISISHVIKKPILFFGKGQNYGDIERFSPKKIVDSIFGEQD